MKKFLAILFIIVCNITIAQNTASGTGYVLNHAVTTGTDCSAAPANYVRFGNGTHRLEICLSSNNLSAACGGGGNKDDRVYVMEDQNNDGIPETVLTIILPTSGLLCFMGSDKGNGYLYLLFCADGTCSALTKASSAITVSWTSFPVPANNLIATPTNITACATGFTANNYAANNVGNCAGYTGNSGPPTNTVISLYNNLDCNTASAGAVAPYNTNGGDVGYSLENDIWYRFCPGVLGTWSITIVPSRCYAPSSGATTTTYGFQYALFQGTSSNLGNVVSGGTNGQNLTSSTTISVNVTSLANCYFLSLDGYGGTGCTFTASITQPIGACIVLPIELISFNGRNNKSYNMLNWSTASELSNDYFTIERSNNGYNWDIVSTLSGAGSSSESLFYSAKDYSFKKEINYYRLKQTDFNGDYKYSEIISIDNSVSTKDIARIINIMGQDVDENYAGVKIIIYTDGTSSKEY